MSDCLNYQESIDEVLALGGGEESLSPGLLEHVGTCGACRAFLEEGLELNRLMEEPLPLPPVDLVEGVMARVKAESLAPESEHRPELEAVEPRLPWAERFAWAVSGAVGMYCLERVPEYSSSWFEGLDTLLFSTEWVFRMPMAVSATSLVAAAFLLFLFQGAIIYGTRGTA